MRILAAAVISLGVLCAVDNYVYHSKNTNSIIKMLTEMKRSILRY